MARPRYHDGAGLYGIVFDNGVKFGMSGDIRARLRAYLHPWSRPVSAIYVLCVQRKSLADAERMVLSLWPDDHGMIVIGTRCGEFVFGIGAPEVLRTFKTVAGSYSAELKIYA